MIVEFKRFEGENPSSLRKIPSIASRSIISSAINLGRFPISGKIINPFPIEDCVENLVIYFGSGLITSTAISASIMAIHSAVKKLLGRGRIAQLINLITHTHTISIAMLIMSEDFQENPGTASLGLALNWFAYVASYSLLNLLFPSPALEKTTSFYNYVGEKLLPIDSSSVSDKDNHTSDSSIKTHYFISEKKLTHLKETLDSLLRNLEHLHARYVTAEKDLTDARKSAPKPISDNSIKHANAAKKLILSAIEELRSHIELLQDDHKAACLAFSTEELVASDPVIRLHALLKQIQRILNELKSKLDRINGVQPLRAEVQTTIDYLRNSSNSITDLLKTLLIGYDLKCATFKAEKNKGLSAVTQNSPPSSTNDTSSDEEEHIYATMKFNP